MSNKSTVDSPNIVDLYDKLKKFANPFCGLVEGPIYNPPYNDETLIIKTNYIYYRDIFRKESDNSTGMGNSLFESRFKSLAEAIERKCTSMQSPSIMVEGTFNNLSNAINPESFLCYEIIPENDRYIVGGNDKFGWLPSFDLLNNKEVLVPAQLVYVPYDMSKEKIIRHPITTGCAAWSDLSHATINGVFELIERDAFMITWLCRRKPNHKIKFSLADFELFDRLDYSAVFYNISIDFPFPTVICVLKDLRGSPALTIGLKTAKNENDACRGALTEAIQVRSWIRDNLPDAKKDHNSHILHHGLHWASPKMVDKLNFLNCKKVGAIKNTTIKELSDSFVLKKIYSYFKKQKFDLYLCDLTLPQVRRENFFVVKCLSPQLVPLYLNEKFKSTGSQRLKRIFYSIYGREPLQTDFNLEEHPFL